jgi:hypothetical protein
MAGASGVAGYEVEAEQRSKLARARGARAVRGKERVGGGEARFRQRGRPGRGRNMARRPELAWFAGGSGRRASRARNIIRPAFTRRLYRRQSLSPTGCAQTARGVRLEVGAEQAEVSPGRTRTLRAKQELRSTEESGWGFTQPCRWRRAIYQQAERL